ncbi:MAG: error-prone DNA polymerase [Alphaproteobacteria bacterium]|nr:error-prone DNA polymerase [Alphaproteobacteria bacterium]
MVSARPVRLGGVVEYVELQVTSNFSFLRGASHPGELAETAAALGLKALALTDRNSLGGVVRAYQAARQVGLRLVVGARLDFTDAPSVLCYPTDRAAYGRLARLLTLGKRRVPKGECWLTWDDLFSYAAGQIVVALPPALFDQADRSLRADDYAADGDFGRRLRQLAAAFPRRCYLAAQLLYRGDDRLRLERLAHLASTVGTPLVATNDVHYHDPARRPLQDVLTCIREHCTIEEAGFRLHANGERYLKPAAEMRRLFRGYEAAVACSAEIAAACRFSLDELRYEYPVEIVPGGVTPQQELERLVWKGAARRFPGGLPESIVGMLNHELKLIGELGYAPYFLTVYDIVKFAESRSILCQGRGSAANSVVCYCLRITAVNPEQVDLLFERFVSAERNEPPDIDVDFEHERREEVIQYIYQKYGRHRAGMTAVYITYRWRSAVREVTKAMGLSEDVGGALAGYVWGWHGEDVDDKQVRELGLDPTDPRLRRALRLTRELMGFPRHLSQHPGGFVITRGPLSEVVPVANAAMPDRTMIEWDKDDIDTLRILKIDVLGLGMLTCIRKAFDLLLQHHGRELSLATVPREDPAVYDMLCRADSIGVFQVESRAQMTMLPRLRPRNFYDLVIEVAIVRPGPIQGDMVHPYLRRRSGLEQVTFPSEELRQVLSKTFGVPLFQEQAMKIAIVAAGFSPSESDGLRRAMVTFRHMGTIHTYRDRFLKGMVERGYDRDFAERCFHQIEGFGEYGFPESHAASFALLVYISAWLKCHYPAVFAATLLNSQPMGFYAPAQIVRDARDHGVSVLPVDVNLSDWDNGLERPPAPRGAEMTAPGEERYALRLGLREIKGLAKVEGLRLVEERDNGGYRNAYELWRRTLLEKKALESLAAADAFGSLGLSRRQALWAVRGLADTSLPLFAAAEQADERRATAVGSNAVPVALRPEPGVDLPAMTIGEEVICDYSTVHLSLRSHPMALLRPRFTTSYMPAAQLFDTPAGRRVNVAGLAICRQRPGTASGVIFMTLEDETGVANIVVWPTMFDRYRRTVLQSRLLGVTGKVEREGIVIHVIASHLVDLSGALVALAGRDLPAPRRRALADPAATVPATVLKAMPAQPWGIANCDAVNVERAIERADEVRHGGLDRIRPIQRVFPSRDFH